MGSFKLLMGSMGEVLIEPAARLSYTLQGLARSFDNLSEGSKKDIGWFAELGIKISAAAIAARSLGLTSIINRAPVAGSIATAAVAVAGVAAYKMMEHGEREVKNAKSLADIATHGGEGYLSEAEAKSSRLWQGIGHLPQQTQREAISQEMTVHLNEQSRLSKKLQAGNLSTEERDDLIEDYRKSQNAYKPTAQLADIATGKGFKPTADAVDKRGGLLREAQGLLIDIQTKSQPGYFSIEDMYKKVQLEALNDSPLQREIRDRDIQRLAKLTAISDDIKKLVEKSGFEAAKLGG